MPSAPFLGMPFKWRWDMVRQRHSAVGGTKRLGIVAVWNRLQCINRQAGTLPRQFETSGNLWPIASQHQTWPNQISLNKCQKWPKNPAPQRQRLHPVVHASRGISMSHPNEQNHGSTFFLLIYTWKMVIVFSSSAWVLSQAFNLDTKQSNKSTKMV